MFDPYATGTGLPVTNFQDMLNAAQQVNNSSSTAQPYMPQMTPAHIDGSMSFMPPSGTSPMQSMMAGQSQQAPSPVQQWAAPQQQAAPAMQPQITPERYEQMQQGIAPQASQSPALQEPMQTQMANPWMQAALYQQAQQTGDYDMMNSIRAQQGLDPIEHNMFDQFKNIISGAPDKSLGLTGQIAQFSLPIIMDLLKSLNTNKYLDQNNSMVNNAMAGNIAAGKAAMGVK